MVAHHVRTSRAIEGDAEADVYIAPA